MLEKKRVNTGALLGLFGAVAALALVILLENTMETFCSHSWP